MNKINLWHLR